ncbi:MFS transporter [Gluconacetobacter tumulisoli]|uniref:MFS transporter n=1 Tax=Gluconacetobacter tumulisoli TaxID=1286189 RepID=A0A7W4PJR4_9PROT|nr:MFS transporter [Gluconacetobacter tumulisoli]MBB2200632.1 MFS transporter [Gluconacetobacter tumulisoli]
MTTHVEHAVPAAPLMRAEAGRTRIMLGLCIGNFLEFYNFMAYAFFAPMIARSFYHSATPIMGLFYSLVTFAIGFFVRPAGAWAMGLYTRRHGHQRTLTATFVMMAAGSGLIAITPRTEQIGALGPVLILLARVLQGFSEGGEVGPVTALLYRIAPPGWGGIFGSLQYFTQLVGSLFAVAFGFALSVSLDHAALYDWGWRIPFLLGIGIFPVGMWLRRGVADLNVDLRAPAVRTSRDRADMRRLWITVMVIFMGVGSGTIAHWLRTFGVSYAVTVLHLSPARGMAAMMLGLGVGIAALLGGMMIARRGPAWRPVVIGIGIVNTLVAAPLYYICIHYPGFWTLTGLNVVLFLLSGLTSTSLWQEMLAALPHESRGFIFGIVYALAVSSLGGLTQPAVTWLIAATGSPMVAGYVMAGALPLGTIAYACLTSSAWRDRRQGDAAPGGARTRA